MGNPIERLRNSFTYTIKRKSNTSAGVFYKDGSGRNILVRLLWGNEKKGKGVHVAYWDYKDNYGNLAPNQQYFVIVISHPVENAPVWEGFTGGMCNTSTNWLKPHKGFHFIPTFEPLTNAVYYSSGNSERRCCANKALKTNLQEAVTLYDDARTGQSPFGSAADASRIYWLNRGSTELNSVWYFNANNLANDSQYIFSSGQAIQEGGSEGIQYSSLVMLPNNDVYDIAVQPTGSFLLISTAPGLLVYNKLTGAIVKTNAAALNIRKITFDRNNVLWASIETGGATAIKKCAIDGAGTVSFTSDVINVNTVVYSMDCKNGSDEIGILDSDDQAKIYSTVTKNLLLTKGTKNALQTNVNVSENTFAFTSFSHTNVRPERNATIRFDAVDDTLWIGDTGLMRLTHYNSSGAVIAADRITYLENTCYKASINESNPTQLFVRYLEYALDWSKPARQRATLVKCWRYSALESDTGFAGIFNAATLSTGETIAMTNSPYAKQIVRMGNSGMVPVSGGYYLDNNLTFLTKEGNLRTFIQANNRIIIKEQPLTDVENLAWGPAVEKVNIAYTDNDSYDSGNPSTWNFNNKTDSGIYLIFNGGDSLARASHLDGLADNIRVAKSALATFPLYSGDYPTNGDFDIGNKGNDNNHNKGGRCSVAGNFIHWGAKNEYYKGTQCCYHNVLTDELLPLAFFGTRSLYNSQPGLPGMAGNAYSSCLVRIGNKLYVTYNDESYYGWYHSWVIDLEGFDRQKIYLNYMLEQGLTLELFNGSNLNPNERVVAQSASTINLVPGTIAGLVAEKVSARYSGFVVPKYGQATTFSISTAGKVTLSIDDIIVIDGWNNAAQNTLTGSYTFSDLRPHRIKLEHDGQNSQAIALKWQSASLPLEVVPVSNLYINTGVSPITSTVNVLEGVKRSGTIANGDFSFVKTPVEDYADNNEWIVLAGKNSYDPLKQSDISFISNRGAHGNFARLLRLPLTKRRLYSGAITFNGRLLIDSVDSRFAILDDSLNPIVFFRSGDYIDPIGRCLVINEVATNIPLKDLRSVFCDYSFNWSSGKWWVSISGFLTTFQVPVAENWSKPTYLQISDAPRGSGYGNTTEVTISNLQIAQTATENVLRTSAGGRQEFLVTAVAGQTAFKPITFSVVGYSKTDIRVYNEVLLPASAYNIVNDTVVLVSAASKDTIVIIENLK